MIRKNTSIKPTKRSRKGATPLSPSEITNLADDGIYYETWSISIHGEITEQTYANCLKALQLMPEADELTVYINSGGGDWDYGIGIYDLLKAQKRTVTTIINGCAQSMGSIIFQAGDIRLVSPNSYLMIHDGTEGVHGAPSSVQAFAKHSAWVQDTMYKIYAERSTKPVAHWKKVCQSDYYITATEAIALGLADGYIP